MNIPYLFDLTQSSPITNPVSTKRFIKKKVDPNPESNEKKKTKSIKTPKKKEIIPDPSIPQWKLIIDNRERSSLEYISHYFASQLQPISGSLTFDQQPIIWRDHSFILITKNSDIGDFSLISPDETLTMVFERKTIADWAQSMKDGRYREQKARLTAFSDQWTAEKGVKPLIYYIIEGELDPREILGNGADAETDATDSEVEETEYETRVEGIPMATLWSSFFHTIIRDNIRIIQSKNVQNSVHILIKSLESAMKYSDNIRTYCSCERSDKNLNQEDYWNAIQINKGKNLTKDIVYRNMLCQIPKVSKKTTDVIVTVYPNLVSLINAYNELTTEEEKETMLKDIVIDSPEGEEYAEGTKPKRKKRIGKELSKQIYHYLMNS
jgi:ERCC4-type nuclease